MRLFTAITLLLSLSACKTTGGDSLTRNEFLASVVERRCEAILTCCDAGYWLMGVTYDTVAECVMYESSTMDIWFKPESTGWDESATGAWEEWFEANMTTCGATLSDFHQTNELDLLRQILPGKVLLGGECSLEYDCAPGLFCSFDSDSCARYVGESAQCEGDWECSPGLLCQNDICAVPRVEGDACVNGECRGDGLHCDSETLLCAPRLLAGEACAVSDDCLSYSCSTEGLCEGDTSFESTYCADTEGN